MLASSFGFTVLDIGVDPSFCIISRQICDNLISASMLHHNSTVVSSERRAAFLFLVGRDEVFLCFFSLGCPWRFWWAGLLVSSIFCLLEGERNEEIGWSYILIWRLLPSLLYLCPAVVVVGDAQVVDWWTVWIWTVFSFFAKRYQSAFSEIHLGAFWNELVISIMLAMWSKVWLSSWCQCVVVNSCGDTMTRSSVKP